MREGYWINYLTGKEFSVDEHERWIRRWSNAKKLGVSEALYDSFDDFIPVKDRDEFLLYVMEKTPVIRMRGHGTVFSFEFNARRVKRPLESIWEFGMENAGDFTSFYVVNFAIKKNIQLLYKDFNQLMLDGREEDVMRTASVFKMKRVSPSMESIFGKKNVKDI